MSFNNRDQELLIEVENHKIDFCALSETKKKGKGTNRYNNYILVHSGKDKDQRATSGVGLLFHDRFEQNMHNVNYVNHRLLTVSFKFGTCLMHMISAYAPDANKPREETEMFYDELQKELDSFSKNDKIIIMGDFNARIGNSVINGVKQRFNEDTINENGQSLIDLCAINELRINNTFFPHKEQHKFTWQNTRNQRSTIDYIITNRNFHPTQILDVRSLSSGNIGTDHSLVLCKIRIVANLIKSKAS